MTQFTANIANKIVTARSDVDDIEPVQKAFMVRFTGTNSRWMGIAKEERAEWVTVYINRQSRALDWFPVADPGRYFNGLDIGFRYVKGHKGKGKNPGMARSIADLRTLKPAEDHVLLLHCYTQEGFEDLVKWYAGDRVLAVGQPPSPTEVSGEGLCEPLVASAASTSPEDCAPAAPAVPANGPMPVVPDAPGGDGDAPAAPAAPGAPEAPDGSEASGDGIPHDSDDSDAIDDEGTAGGGWMADPKRRKAVEVHAVAMATVHYAGLGFVVEERGKPFDLLCTPTDACESGSPTVHVEVKGSLGPATIIHLTRNEIADARHGGPWRSDLYIVSGIQLNQDATGAWAAAGGVARWIEDWKPLDGDLTPTDYVYAVPARRV